MQFYTKNNSGEETDATDIVNDIVKNRLEQYKESESAKIREETEKSTREELTTTITKEVEEKIKGEFQPKLDEAEAKSKKLDVQLRQKTIAAEYGFKSDIEKFLGEGDDEEMRKAADALKSNLITTKPTAPKKVTKNSAKGDSFIKLQEQ